MVCGNDKDCPIWLYLLLKDDDNIIDKYRALTQGQWGTEPPNDVKDWIEKNYGVTSVPK